MSARSNSRTRRGVASFVLACACVLGSADGAALEWTAATTATRVATRVRGGRGYVALAAKSTSPTCTGTFAFESDFKFVLGETSGGPARTYTGMYLPRSRGNAMLLALDDAGRAALAEKIREAAWAAALNERVFVESVEVDLKSVSRPVLVRPVAYRTRAATFVASGTYRVTWRYDAGFPFPPYHDVSTWRFTFRAKVVVGAAQ